MLSKVLVWFWAQVFHNRNNDLPSLPPAPVPFPLFFDISARTSVAIVCVTLISNLTVLFVAEVTVLLERLDAHTVSEST